MRRIKTVQFIDIFQKVGLMNQAPTRIKSRQEVILYIKKVGLINQTPTEDESDHTVNQVRTVN